MPLASSREASLKRAERVAAERKEQARRNMRLSLPNTCDSSTVATEDKARRRQSLRRQSIASFKVEQKKKRESMMMMSKENDVPQQQQQQQQHYSPPETRSAKKKKQRIDAPPTSKGIVMSFSPPDQKENARREAEELRRKEAERQHRVQQARVNGQLQVYSPSNRPLAQRQQEEKFCLDLSSPPDPTGQHVSVPLPQNSANSKTESETSNLTESEAPHTAAVYGPEIKELLERMDGRIGQIAADKLQASEAALQQEKMRADTLQATSDHLKETNQKLQEQAHQLNESHASEKQSFLVEKTRLEIEWKKSQEATSKATAQLQEVRSHLEGQIDELKEDRQLLKEKVISLEKDLEATSEKLAETKELLDGLRSKNATEKDSLAVRYDRLEADNASLTNQLHESKEGRLVLEREMDALKHSLSETQAKWHASMDDLKAAQDAICEFESKKADLETQNGSLTTMVQELQDEIVKLNEENERECLNFQKLNEDSSKAFEKMTLDAAEKDKQIGDLFRQLGEIQQQIQEERAETAQVTTKMELSQQHLEAQVNELNKALEDAMNQIDGLEEERRSLKQQLTQTKEALEESRVSITVLEEKSQDEMNKLNGELEELCRELEESQKGHKEIKQQLQETKALLKEATSGQENAKSQATETSNALCEVKNTLSNERLRREELERRVRELERDLQTTEEERDNARSNMLGFNEREEELYRRLREGDRIRREMHGKLIQLMGNIRVFVRVRPPLDGEMEKEQKRAASKQRQSMDGKKRKREDDDGNTVEENPFRFPGIYDRDEKRAHMASAVDDATKNAIEVREPHKDRGGLSERRKVWRWSFDKVFSPHHGQEDVWDATEPLIQCAVDGFNVTVFAYGQTGSGKTHTMLGEPGNEGIIARAVKKLYEAKTEIEALSRGDSQVSMSVELLEVYNEKVRDLLAPKCGPDGQEMNLKVTSQEVVGNTIVSTTGEDEVMQILALAQSRRCVKATASNSESSRSHMLFTIHFEVTNKDGSTRKGKLNVCDLAGSERLSKSGTNVVGGALLEETKNINKSLSTLSNVIERLQAGDKNVPFRESKLTFLLKDSLSGNSKTLAIVCCNPLAAHVNESVSSLRFAAKVNRVDLKAHANVTC